ncbi:hypothetical protein BDZ97DRAFT_1074890 [Flammula alnicola]|nr:hypothetical protein BDZ97DRAFT_1074890 [Flammula alnicola]
MKSILPAEIWVYKSKNSHRFIRWVSFFATPACQTSLLFRYDGKTEMDQDLMRTDQVQSSAMEVCVSKIQTDEPAYETARLRAGNPNVTQWILDGLCLHLLLAGRSWASELRPASARYLTDSRVASEFLLFEDHPNTWQTFVVFASSTGHCIIRSVQWTECGLKKR